MYGLRLFIVVLQELHCLLKIKHAYSMVVMNIYQNTSFVSQLCPVIEICELKLKNNEKTKNCENKLSYNQIFEDTHCLTIGTIL